MESVPFSSGRRYELGAQPINFFAYPCGPTLIAQPTVRSEGVYLNNGFSPLECTQDFLAMKSSPSELLVTSYPDNLPSFRCSGKKRPLSSYSISPGTCCCCCCCCCLFTLYSYRDRPRYAVHSGGYVSSLRSVSGQNSLCGVSWVGGTLDTSLSLPQETHAVPSHPH